MCAYLHTHTHTHTHTHLTTTHTRAHAHTHTHTTTHTQHNATHTTQCNTHTHSKLQPFSSGLVLLWVNTQDSEIARLKAQVSRLERHGHTSQHVASSNTCTCQTSSTSTYHTSSASAYQTSSTSAYQTASATSVALRDGDHYRLHQSSHQEQVWSLLYIHQGGGVGGGEGKSRNSLFLQRKMWV